MRFLKNWEFLKEINEWIWNNNNDNDNNNNNNNNDNDNNNNKNYVKDGWQVENDKNGFI